MQAASRQETGRQAGRKDEAPLKLWDGQKVLFKQVWALVGSVCTQTSVELNKNEASNRLCRLGDSWVVGKWGLP